MQPLTYEYDAFLSYKTEDSDWAERLAGDLTKSNLTVFFDRRSLRAGVTWLPELEAALKKSRHLVVLASDAVDKSDYVTFEIAAFRYELARLDPIMQRKANRRIIEVQLQGGYRPLNGEQSIKELLDARAFDAGIGWIDTNRATWNTVVSKITDALREDADWVPITTAVLAMTADDVEQLIDQKAARLPLGEPWSTMLAKLEMDPKTIKSFYGDRRRDWKPFGTLEVIDSVLARVRSALEQRARGEHFRIEHVQDAFWSSSAPEAKLEAAKLGKGLALLVIDPLSLYDQVVKSRFDFLDPCLQNPLAAIMLPSPFALPDRASRLRQMIENMANKVYEQFYFPPLEAKDPYANYSVMTSDELDVSRLMLTILRDYQKTVRPKGSSNAFLGVMDQVP